MCLPTKVRLVKATVFPVVMYGCESWTVKKAERQRIDAFELWCWPSGNGNEHLCPEGGPGSTLQGLLQGQSFHSFVRQTTVRLYNR